MIVGFSCKCPNLLLIQSMFLASLILFILLDISTGETINCEKPGPCTCTGDEFCTLQCKGSQQCLSTQQQMTLNCKSGYGCAIDCDDGVQSCQNTIINANDATNLTVKCHQWKDCQNATINCGSTQYCAVHCDNESVTAMCENLKLNCGTSKCIISCTGNVANDTGSCRNINVDTSHPNLRSFQCIAANPNACKSAPAIILSPTYNPTSNPTSSPRFRDEAIPELDIAEIQTNDESVSEVDDLHKQLIYVIIFALLIVLCIVLILIFYWCYTRNLKISEKRIIATTKQNSGNDKVMNIKALSPRFNVDHKIYQYINNVLPDTHNHHRIYSAISSLPTTLTIESATDLNIKSDANNRKTPAVMKAVSHINHRNNTDSDSETLNNLNKISFDTTCADVNVPINLTPY